MANFSRGTYTVYERKGVESDSVMSPVSPTNNIATSNHSTGKTITFAAVGGLVAQSAIGAARSEISASTGNEVLQNSVNNTLLAFGYGALLLKGGGIAAIGLTIKGGVDEIKRQRTINRQNYALSIENKLKGARVNVGKGSVYYD